MSLLWYWSWLLLIILHGCIGRNVLVDWFTFFVIYHKVCNWIISQDINVLLDWYFVSFPVVFRWVCIFRGFSRSSLVCNLGDWVSSIALIARSTDKYVHIVKINGLYYLQSFRCWGLLVLCVVAGGFCLGVAFTSVGGECLHTTELRFGRLVSMSLSVLYGGLFFYVANCRFS